MRRKFLLSVVLLSLLFMAMGGGKLYAEGNVAKVGDTEYTTIDEAIANWTNNTTLTLLANVTLSDVVTIKSTEHHILNLGTYTMTAASGKNAFVIQACGTGDAERNAITINADATNPGGIDAGSKCVVYYKYADGGISGNDRPIIKINGGVFTGSTSSWGTAGIYTIGTEARKCATLNISGGTFNCTINGIVKSKLIVSGGVFNYSVGSQGDSTASRLIYGGTFKSFGFMTADSNNTKFWIGTSMANSNVGAYIDDNGYLVVGGPVVTEPGTNFEASSQNHSNAGFGNYLTYSSVATNGIYYTSVEEALTDNNKTGVSVTVYVDELDMADFSSYKGTIVVPEGSRITITNAPENLVVKDEEGNVLESNANGTYTTVTPEGNDFTGYTRTDAIWGEVWGNASESFVIKVLDANGNVMGTTSLNNVDGIIDGDVNVTWSLKLDAASNTDEYWTMIWTTAPTIDNMPAKVELWVDGVKVSGGNVVLNAPDNLNPIYAAVTDADRKIIAYYTNVQEAIKAAAPAGTVEILADVVVDEWIMFSETLNISSGQIITMNIDGLTINGNGKTVTIKSIESAGNGNRLFYDAAKLNINNWTIKYADGVAGGIGLTSGIINKVTIEGGAGVFPGTGNITISECNFKTSGHCIYFEEERDGLVVTNNTFELPADANVILLRGDVTFTGNNVKSGRTVNVVSGSPVVSDNNFNDVRFKVYDDATATISENTINVLAFEDDSEVVLSTFGVNTLSTEAQAVLEGANFPVAQIGTTKYGTLAEAVAAVQEDQTIQLLAGEISEGTIKLPATLKNVTFIGAANHASVLKDMTIMAADGNSFNYEGLTFDGIYFYNSRISLTGWRNGDETIEDLTITNCIVENLYDDTNLAFLHINKDASEPAKNLTFTNNVLNGVTGGYKSGVYSVNTGNVIIKGNTFNNIVFRPALVQLSDCDDIVDNVEISNNVISNTTRLQVYGTEVDNGDGTYTPTGTDELEVKINNNIFKNISGYYICTWGINGDYDISKNYYDSDNLSEKIYWNNEKPSTVSGLYELGVYPVYTELNPDGTINTESEYTPNIPFAQIGETGYPSLEAAAAAAQAGDEILLLVNVTLSEALTTPAGITLNGNGKQINGSIVAGGDLTIKGHTKVTSFNAGYNQPIITIGEGACLEMNGADRMVIGHGATFNITGTITDAKNANVADLTPSLIMPGASFTGAGVTFNVTNAYINAPSSYCSSSKSASGTFVFKFDNSIWESAGKLAFESQSTAATVNFELKDSKLTTGSHLVFGVSRGEVVFDNSHVNVGTSRQIENQSTMTVKNGSVVNGAVATSSNAKNPGTLIVDNATYAVTGEFSGSDLGTGTLIIKKGANVSVGSIKAGANVVVDAEGMAAGDEINFTANLSQFTGTLSVINNDKLEAKIVDGKIILVVKPVAKIGDVEYTTLEDAFASATSGCTIEILSDVTVDYDWDCRYTGSKFTVPVTINGNDKTIKFTGAIDDKNWNTVFRFEEEATVNNLTVNIEGATTVQRVITAKKSLNVDDLTIVGSSKYGIIFGEGASAEVLAATEIVIKNSALNGTRRAVSDNEGGKDVKSVVIEGNNLTANVYVSASESIVFNNNTTTSEVDLRSYAADNVLSVEAKDNELNEEVKNYIYAKNIDAQEEFTTENPPLKVANKAELNAAIAAAKEGNVITLTADIDYGTDQLKIEKAITLDLGGKTLTTRNAYGGMSIKNNPTIKNGNIVHASNTAAIKVWNATAFEDLVIDVQGKGDANKTIGGIVLQEGSTTCVGSIKNVTIKGEALTNGIETYNCGNATENVIGSMEYVVINAVGTAMKISAPCGTATDCSFNGGDTGIELWIKGTYSASLDLVECEVSGGKKSVYIHDEFNSNPVVNTGDLKLTADNATTFESESGAPIALTIAHTEGEIDYELIDKLIETTVAKVNDVYYTTLQAAIKVAQPGDVVKVFEGEYSVPSMKAGITIEGVVEGEGEVLFQGTLGGTLENLTLKNIHIKGANAQRWAYAKGNLVFENVIFEATSVYAIHFDGITEGTNLLYKNCTIIGWAAMGGSPASCEFEGCTIKDNGTYGVIRTYFDATIERCTFDIANVNTTDNYQDGIHAVSGANVIVTDCTNENGDMIDVINVGDTSVVVLDGVEIKNIVKVAKKDENPKYYRTLPEAFAAAGDGSNTTVTLLADVDLDGAEWTPVNFNGVFDGQDHTISNLTITGYNSNVGFFGQTNNGEIKNLTIKNANVSGRLNVGVVAGTPYTSKYTNIKVTGHVEVNGMAYVGGVGGKNAYANWTDITVDVDETSYVKANSVEDGTAYRTYVGGVIGFNGEGSHTFKNITSNIKVIGSTCDIGGIFGIAHYGNNFENIEHSGSVINETNDATEALETGLIAGVWHNAKDTSVTFTNATSTGTISAPNTDVTFPNNSLVGAAYNASNETASTSGSLVINGETVYPYVAKIGEVGYTTLTDAVAAANNDETIKLLWAEGEAPIAMNASLYGKNVTITGTAKVDWSKGWLFVGRGGAGDAILTFDNANLTSASDNASTGIHVSGSKKDNVDNTYYGTVIIKNSTIELDYLIQKNVMTLDKSTLTVKNGFAVGGRPASETESGADATATMTLNNGSKVVVNNHNGMGLGYEAIGVMDINSGSTFECTQSFLVTAKGTMNVNGGNVKVDGTLTNNGEYAINVNEGESTLNITTLTGESINLNEGAIVKNSTVGGAAYVAGNVLFRGDNTFAMITDYGDYYSSTTPSMWTVEAGASLTLTKTDRYGLGYGDKVTVYGEIEDALTARESLTDADASVNMYGGLVGMTNSASPDANNVFKAEDAYLIFGVNGDKSFGNKSGDYYGNYDIDFANCVVTANGFKFYEDKGNSDVYFNNSDLLVNGVLMTNDASSKFTFENSVVLSKATSNGTDDKNQNAGVLTLVNTTMTYSAAFTNVGNLNIGENSTFTAPEVVNNGTINFTAPSAILVAQEGLAINLALDNPEYYEIEYAYGAYSVKQVIFEQTQTLSSGWNWFSSYINLNSNAGLETLQNALGKNGIEIKSHNSGYVRYDNTYEFWWGSLSAVAADQMYMIRTSTQVDNMKLVGEMVDHNNVSITLKPGWNWIGFPMSEAVSVENALNGLSPNSGDIIKSLTNSYAEYTYYETLGIGTWSIALSTLTPGEGYMYYNSSSETKTFTYNVSRSNAELKANITTDGNHWTPNAGQYPNNMTMTAMVEVEGGDYEVAAFVNGECRGSARPIYIEALDAHILFLTIHGEDVEEMTFRYYDIATGEEFDLNDRMNYSNDAIVGTIAEPYIFSRGTTGIGEASLSEVNIYPNPTTTGTEINLQATCDTVEVFNALGVKVAEYHNVDSLDAFETAGIYVIRLTNNGDVKHCRLIVK